QPAMEQALDRLATATDSKKATTGTLGTDAVFERVKPQTDASFVFYVKRDQKFGEWQPPLAAVDEYIRNAFVLAPKDPAVAFAVGESGVTRCSFRGETRRPWTQLVPAGVYSLEL